MSRRLRIDESKALQEKEEKDRGLDPHSLQLRRIYSPTIWMKKSGFRVQDLQEQHYDQVVEIFRNYYVPNDLLCRNTELMEDEESLNCWLDRILCQLQDQCTLIAVDENYVHENAKEETWDPKHNRKIENIKIAGILILRIVHKTDQNRIFSQVQLIEGEAMEKCIAFRSHMHRNVDIHEKCNCEEYLRVYELCVTPEYRHLGLGHLLMTCSYHVAISFDISVVAGFFPTQDLQKLVRRFGMETIYEMSYGDWRDPEGEIVIDDPGPGNYTCAVMAGKIPNYILNPRPRTPPPPLLHRSKTREEKQVEKVNKMKNNTHIVTILI